MTTVPREELLARLRRMLRLGHDADRFIRSARAGGDISADTAAWLSRELGR